MSWTFASTGRLNVTPIPSFTNSTVMAWVQVATGTVTQMLFSWSVAGGAELISADISSTEVLRITTQGSSTTLTGGGVVINRWYHVAFQCIDAGVYGLFVDGKNVNRYRITADTTTTINLMALGNHAAGFTSSGWLGKMCAAKIFNQVLTPEEIRREMRTYRAAHPSCIGAWAGNLLTAPFGQFQGPCQLALTNTIVASTSKSDPFYEMPRKARRVPVSLQSPAEWLPPHSRYQPRYQTVSF